MATMQMLIDEAANKNIEVHKVIRRDDGRCEIMLWWDLTETSARYFGTGWEVSEQASIDFSYEVVKLTEDEIMRLLQNDKLLPHIQGEMLPDGKRKQWTLSGKFKEAEMPKIGNGEQKYKIEIFFTDTNKSAKLNEKQLLNLISVHGDETNNWNGKPVVLYAEKGKAFGKPYNALRVDVDATRAALNNKPKTVARKPKTNNRKQSSPPLDPPPAQDLSEAADLKAKDQKALI